MPIAPLIHPFPGLRPFEADEQELFFGREGQSEEILLRLRQHRFVAVVGASGSGKSSLIRAGLLPYLHGGFLAQGGTHWRVAIFRPSGDPIKNLAAALGDPAMLGPQAENADAAAQNSILLEVSLRRSGLGLIEAVRLARLPEREQVLIVVDQFEELFRFANTTDKPGRDDDAAAFVKLLLETSQQRELPIYVVLTMRSDYIGDCARYRDLPEAVTNALYLIPRMTREQRRAAIVEPVRVGGRSIAPRLVVRLLNDVGDDPDQLPILQHALMRTWDYWKTHGDDRTIDVDDYLAIGGMKDALSRHADEAYDGLPDDRYRAIAARVFRALSEKGPDNREARRLTTVETLSKVVDAPIVDIIRVVEDFSASGRSFLTSTQGVALHPGSVIDISHESLIRGWRRMRQWVEEEAESARQYRRLADTASRHAQGVAGLLRDPDLQNVLTWHDRERPNPDWANRYVPGFEQAMTFLEQSRLAREAERQQRQTARRRMQLAFSAATTAIAIVAVVALWLWGQAKIESERAIRESERAIRESERAQQALEMTTKTANTLVFDLGQDSHVRTLPKEILTRLFDGAIKGYDQVIKLNPTTGAYNGRGSAYYAEGKIDDAIADYSKAIELDPLPDVTYRNRGNAYNEKKDYDRAIADFDKAITLNPKSAVAYYSRGRADQAKLDFDRAIADLDKAIAIDPKYAFAYFYRGRAYLNKDDLDRAIADFDKAITIDSTLRNAHYDRGIAFEANNDFDTAIAEFDKIIGLDQYDAVAIFDRGIANLYRGALPMARADLSRSAELNPRYPYTAIWLDIVDKRSNAPSRLAQTTTQVDMSKWPAPVIQLYLGLLTPADVLAAAADPDAETKKGQVCEANFYSGELALQQGANEEAARRFRLAATGCSRTFIEWPAANAELRALGAIPAGGSAPQ
jgi:tetratricopeptide (TPR) repeat protein